MDILNLEKVLENEPAYRLKQAKEAVLKNFISNWDEATFLPLELRKKLNKECPLEIKADVLVSSDKSSVKAGITLKDGLMVETALMKHNDGRNTVCVSSQVGCALGCVFCATGKMGFKRNLSVEEILEQVIFFERYLKAAPMHQCTGAQVRAGDACRVTNVTFMGMGEPFLNYENVLKSIRILNDKNYFNIGARSISVSTAGIIEGIEKLIEEGLSRKAGSSAARQLNLAISLHAPNQELRNSLMPISKKYPLQKVFGAVDKYIKATKRKVMFEYLLIDNVNDSNKCAEELAKLMRKKLYFLNLILYNPIPQKIAGQAGKFSAKGGPASGWKPSPSGRVESFKKILKREGVNFVQRYRFGRDIKAACGQLIHR